MNSGPGFSNIQNAPPTVQQPAQSAVPQRIIANRRYLISLTGILRIALIVNDYRIIILNLSKFKYSRGTEKLENIY